MRWISISTRYMNINQYVVAQSDVVLKTLFEGSTTY
nr:MAG TPA: hypothetical protein [Bacteriophage sp.]